MRPDRKSRNKRIRKPFKAKAIVMIGGALAVKADIFEQKIFRDAVFVLDKVCRGCGINRGQAHHIVYKAHCPEWARTDARNGITLCPQCHKNVHEKGAEAMIAILDKYKNTDVWRWDWAYEQVCLRAERENYRKGTLCETKG